jgi:hypothetical protein
MDALKACASSRDSVLKGGSVASSVSLAIRAPWSIVSVMVRGLRLLAAKPWNYTG